MAEKPRVLLFFCEGLADTVIDSQVLSLARDLGAAAIADFEILTLPWHPAMLAASESKLPQAEALAGCKVHIRPGMRPAYPLARRHNAAMLADFLAKSGPFDVIHARTDYAAQIAAGPARRAGIRLIWDCRGDAAAEFDYRSDLRGAKGLLLPLLRHGAARRFRAAGQACDAALFVSTRLQAMAQPHLDGKDSAVIPCTAADSLFFFDPALRQQTRAELGYAAQDCVFIYSGGMQPYQRFDDTLLAFARLAARNAQARLLVASPRREQAQQKIAAAGLPGDRVQLVTAPLARVNALLNAADCAFLLRHPTPTNLASSPTKFAEYCLAGLPVAITQAIPDSFAKARQLSNLVAFDDASLGLGDIPVFDRVGMARRASEILGRRAHFDDYRRLYGAPMVRGSAKALASAPDA